MKVCDLCLEEQGVMEVVLTPDDDIHTVYFEVVNTGKKRKLELCGTHTSKLDRAAARGE